jgi:hypothetical protein
MVPNTTYKQLGVLAAVLDDVGKEIGQRLDFDLRPPWPTDWQTAEAFSRALDPLGEAVTELGRLQGELASRMPHCAPSGAPEDRLSDEVITGCLEAAVEALEYAAARLRETAVQLAPPVSPRAPASRPSSQGELPLPAQHPAATAPRTASGR